MGAFHPEPIQPLGPEECWTLLEGVPVGRLGVVMAGEPDVFPVNFAVDDRGLVVRTDIGTKFSGRRFTLNDAARAAQAGG